MKPGERRTFQAWAAAGLTVEIKCFTNNPPPAGYKPCAACGYIDIKNGQELVFEADPNVFQSGGTLEITVRDLSGDRREFRLPVQP